MPTNDVIVVMTIKGTDRFVILRFAPGFGGISNIVSQCGQSDRLTEDAVEAELAEMGFNSDQIKSKIQAAKENPI